MMQSIDSNIKFFDDPLKLYNSMLDDIDSARKYIYIETYKYGNDPIGMKFRDALIRKAKQGIEVKLLIDSWGASVGINFFTELTRNGGKVRLFKKIRLSWDFFTKSHRRDHRKLLLIDDKISYIGSANISYHSFNWRESVLKINGDLAISLKSIFLGNYRIYNKYIYDKISFSQIIQHNNYEIIRDIPSTVFQPVKKKFVELIKNAQKEIIIETPYFLPGSYVRKALCDAGKRGVEVKIITPKRSDVGMVDLLRGKYFGELYKSNVKILFYIPQNLHSKIFIVDKEIFVVGSSNFDYRSFRFQHEICLAGNDKNIIYLLLQHIDGTLQECEKFNYEFWKRRALIQKAFEWIMIPFRHLF